MSKTGYVQNLAFVDGLDVEEKYALASHCIQLGDRTEGEKYREKLTEAGFGINNLPTKEEFNKQHSITLEPDKPKFSFIDLFAGIGGFRIAMQSLGGQCVFSSEWDEAVKETYFQNYGEVPFGDITKPEISTTGLAGGLLTPYKGLLPALRSKDLSNSSLAATSFT